jgi:hypothetical protein
MADDHNALLARAALIVADGKPGWPTVRDLVAELRALTSRHHTALDAIRDAVDWWDNDPDGPPEMVALQAVLDQAKDPDHE